MNRRISLRILIYLLILLSITVPNCMYILRGIKGTVVLFIIFIAMTIINGKMIIKGDFSKSGYTYTIVALILGYFWILVEILFDKGIGWEYILYLYCSISIFIICDCIIKSEFKDQYLVVLKVFIIIWGVSLLTSFFYGISNTYIVKYVTGGSGTLSNEYISATMNGIGNSVYYLGIATILPLFISRWLAEKYYINRLVDSILIVLLILNIIISVSVTALAISILGIILVILFNIFSIKIYQKELFKLYLKITTLIFSIVIVGVLVLNIYSDNEGISLFTDRVSEIINSINNSGEIVDASQQGRDELKEISINTFYSYPILGNGTGMGSIDKRIINGIGNGNHASFFDILAMYGIIGGIIWFMLYWGLIKICQYRIKGKNIILERGLNVSKILFCISMLFNPTLVNSQYVILVFMFMFTLDYSI